MTDITPLGVVTDDLDGSRRFYGRAMGIERVILMRGYFSDELPYALLRLESPQIEIISTELKLFDREVNRSVKRNHRVVFRPKDMGALLRRLSLENIEMVANPCGGLSFEDCNGINWELRAEQGRYLQNSNLDIAA